MPDIGLDSAARVGRRIAAGLMLLIVAGCASVSPQAAYAPYSHPEPEIAHDGAMQGGGRN